MRLILTVFALLVALSSMPVWAQEKIPLPRPRPESRMPPTPPGSIPDAQAGELDPGDASAAIDAIAPRDAAKAALTKALAAPLPVTLSAKITAEGPLIPSGLVWRVYSINPQQPGQLGLVGRSTDSAAVFHLAPGEYQAHVSYGNAQASDTILVETAPTARTLVIDSGALRLSAQITGDIDLTESDLRFDIYPVDADEDPNAVIVSDVQANRLVELNAGVYHVVSRYGKVNAVVRADLKVEPGQLTDATLFHDAAPINFTLVSEAGGEAIADVEWSVKDSADNVVFTDLGAFPHTILEAGDYSVFAKLGSRVFNRQFQVSPGKGTEIEVLTTVYDQSAAEPGSS